MAAMMVMMKATTHTTAIAITPPFDKPVFESKTKDIWDKPVFESKNVKDKWDKPLLSMQTSTSCKYATKNTT